MPVVPHLKRRLRKTQQENSSSHRSQQDSILNCLLYTCKHWLEKIFFTKIWQFREPVNDIWCTQPKNNIEIFNSYENWFIKGTSKSLITSTKYTLSTASQMEQLFRVSMPYSPINDKKRTTLSDRTWKQILSLPPVQSWWILKWLASLLWVTTVQTQKSKFVSFTSRKPFTEKYSSLVVLFSIARTKNST